MEDESVVTEGIGVSTGYKLLKAYDELIDLGILAWQYHFEFLNLGYAAYVVFVDFCQKAFPDIPLQKITQMVGGIDVIIYQPDEELKKLAKLAIDLGVDEIAMNGRTPRTLFSRRWRPRTRARNGSKRSTRPEIPGFMFPPGPAGITTTRPGMTTSIFPCQQCAFT